MPWLIVEPYDGSWEVYGSTREICPQRETASEAYSHGFRWLRKAAGRRLREGRKPLLFPDPDLQAEVEERRLQKTTLFEARRGKTPFAVRLEPRVFDGTLRLTIAEVWTLNDL